MGTVSTVKVLMLLSRATILVLPVCADDILLFVYSSSVSDTNQHGSSSSAVLTAECSSGSYSIAKELLYL